MVLREDTTDTQFWMRLPVGYLAAKFEQLTGGVKLGTHRTYMGNVKDYWQTMRKLQIHDSMTFAFPVRSAQIEAWIIDCNQLRTKPNCYTTVRGKMCALDYVVKLSGHYQDWKTNPRLVPSIEWTRKMRPGKGSDTLPVLRADFRDIMMVAIKSLAKGLQLSIPDRQRLICLRNTSSIKQNPHKFKEYAWIVAILVTQLTGCRGSELFPNSQKGYEDYGVRMKHIRPIFKGPKIDNVEILIPESKTARRGHAVVLVIGPTGESIEPALVLYEFWIARRDQGAGNDDFLFPQKLSAIKQRWTTVVAKAIKSEPERFKFHGTRKGFASQLLRCGVPMSLISYAGRWKQREAIFDYLIHSRKQLKQIAWIYLYAPEVPNWFDPEQEMQRCRHTVDDQYRRQMQHRLF